MFFVRSSRGFLYSGGRSRAVNLPIVLDLRESSRDFSLDVIVNRCWLRLSSDWVYFVVVRLRC